MLRRTQKIDIKMRKIKWKKNGVIRQGSMSGLMFAKTLNCLATNCETISNWRNPGILQESFKPQFDRGAIFQRMKKFKGI